MICYPNLLLIVISKEYYMIKNQALSSQISWLNPLFSITTKLSSKDKKSGKSPKARGSIKKSLFDVFSQISKTKSHEPNSSNNLNQLKLISTPKSEHHQIRAKSLIKWWYLWNCVLRLCFLKRHKVLTFQTPQTWGIIDSL